jgi:hypothetical protein
VFLQTVELYLREVAVQVYLHLDALLHDLRQFARMDEQHAEQANHKQGQRDGEYHHGMRVVAELFLLY